jgi:hypothetical protein
MTRKKVSSSAGEKTQAFFLKIWRNVDSFQIKSERILTYSVETHRGKLLDTLSIFLKAFNDFGVFSYF